MSIFIENNLLLLLLISLAIGVFSILINVYLIIKTVGIGKKNKILFSGKDALSLESVILKQSEDLKDMDKEIQELFEISNKINNLVMHSLHKVGIIRYNPFKDLGGDQSFAIALLDGKNSGLVISSLHTREGTRVYAKPIAKSESKKYPLTEEEKQAIKIAGTIKEATV